MYQATHTAAKQQPDDSATYLRSVGAHGVAVSYVARLPTRDVFVLVAEGQTIITFCGYRAHCCRNTDSDRAHILRKIGRLAWSGDDVISLNAAADCARLVNQHFKKGTRK